MINTSIFKSYDIRGAYPGELTDEAAFRIGRAFAELIKNEESETSKTSKTSKTSEEITIVVGRDVRLSSPVLAKRLIAGIMEQGVNVVNIGKVSTPAFYFFCAKNGYDGGAMVTASHNPVEFNGFKLVRGRARELSGTSGLDQIKNTVDSEFVSAARKGTVNKKRFFLSDEIKFVLNFVNVKEIKPLKVVIDAGNGMAGAEFKRLFRKLPCKLIQLNFKPDGTFPNHPANPSVDANNAQLKAEVLKCKADLGIALDGDGDRIDFIDNEGQTVPAAICQGVLSKIFLKNNSGAKICYDVRPGKIKVDMIEDFGGVPIITPVGGSLIKEQMEKEGAIFGSEASGHYFIKSEFGIFEMPIVVALKMLEELSVADVSMSEYVAPLKKYFHSNEINFEVKNKQAVFERLKNKYGSNLKYDFDGLSFEWSDWWFNVRSSNTEGKVRLNLEAMSENLMKVKRDEVVKLFDSQ